MRATGGRASTWRAVLLLAVTFVVYAPALRGGYLWDDRAYVADNHALRSVGGLADLWRVPPSTPQYYPAVFTTYWLEYRLWGTAPLGYHVTNVLLQWANALLAWRLLATLEVPGAFLAAAIFALHPVQVESVAWIAERKNVLSGLFALGATLAWLAWIDERRWGRYVAVCALFTCALLSKTAVCTLPAILFLLVWWKKPRDWRSVVLPLVPLAMLAAGGAALAILCEHPRVEPELPMPALGSVARVLVAGRALWFYAAKLAWPFPLMAVYPHWTVDPTALRQYVQPLGVLLVATVLWAIRGRVGRGPLVAAAAFAASLAPTLGLVNFDFMQFAFVADHFQYLASLPLIALGTAAGVRLLDRAAHRFPPVAGYRAVVAGTLLLLLAARSRERAAVHRDAESLWRDNVAGDPAGAPGHNHLGVVLLAEGRFDDAIAEFAVAARLDPRYADAHNNWGSALKATGRLDDALAQYREAARVNPKDPVARNNIGTVLALEGRPDEAIGQFADALRLDPDYAAAENNWGATLYGQGQVDAAIGHYTAALRHDAGYAEAERNWGIALASLGRADAALPHFAAAARLDSSSAAAQVDLGIALLGAGEAAAAVAPLTAAVALDPSLADAHHHLGVALGMTGRLDAALVELATAARLRPDDADVQNHWGVALSRAGRADDAAARFREAIRLRPDHVEARQNLAHAAGGN